MNSQKPRQPTLSLHGSVPDWCSELKGKADTLPPSLTQNLAPISSHLKMRNQLSPRESHWESKPLLQADTLPSSRRTDNTIGSLSHNVIRVVILFYFQFFIFPIYRYFCIYYGFQLWLFFFLNRIPKCMSRCVSAPLCISCAFSLILFLFGHFVIV